MQYGYSLEISHGYSTVVLLRKLFVSSLESGTIAKTRNKNI